MSNINNYPLTAVQINDEDFYDVDYWTGTSYESRKISGLTLKNILGALPPLASGLIWQGDAGGVAQAVPLPSTSSTLYSADGTLISNRVVNGGTFELTFEAIKKWKTEITPTTLDIGYHHLVDASSMNTTDVVWKIDCVGNNICSLSLTKNGRLMVTPSPLEPYILPVTNGFRPSGGYSVYVTDDQTPSQGSFQNMDFMAQQIESFLSVGNNFASTQWDTSATNVPLANGTIANGMTFFTDADKDTNGITSWDEYDLSYGIDLTFTGTSGTASVDVVATLFTATFNTDLNTTASDFVTLHSASMLTLGIRLLYNGGATIRFSGSEADCNSVAITNLTGDLDGTRLNPFTGLNASAPDHIIIPYVGEPYEGQRLQHKFRVNFGIATGSTQTLGLSLRRFEDDSIIGSEMKVVRDQDVEGNQFTFLTYTSGANDPFVLGGFYFALRNDSGGSVDINGNIGIYIETMYQSPTIFP